MKKGGSKEPPFFTRRLPQSKKIPRYAGGFSFMNVGVNNSDYSFTAPSVMPLTKYFCRKG